MVYISHAMVVNRSYLVNHAVDVFTVTAEKPIIQYDLARLGLSQHHNMFQGGTSHVHALNIVENRLELLTLLAGKEVRVI